MVISSNHVYRTIQMLYVLVLLLLPPRTGQIISGKRRTIMPLVWRDRGSPKMPELDGKQGAGVPNMGQSTVLQLKRWLTNGKQHEENYSKASECSGRGNHNNDSAVPLAAIRVDKQEGHILIGSSFWFARKALPSEICMRWTSKKCDAIGQ